MNIIGNLAQYIGWPLVAVVVLIMLTLWICQVIRTNAVISIFPNPNSTITTVQIIISTIATFFTTSNAVITNRNELRSNTNSVKTTTSVPYDLVFSGHHRFHIGDIIINDTLHGNSITRNISGMSEELILLLLMATFLVLLFKFSSWLKCHFCPAKVNSQPQPPIEAQPN